MFVSLGLFEQNDLTPRRPSGLGRLFANVLEFGQTEIIGENSQSELQGARLLLDGSAGYGSWELYRLAQDRHVVVGDCAFEAPRVETLIGEGLIEFHLRLAGTLQLTLPAHRDPLTVTGPCMVMLYQPCGVDVRELALSGSRDTGMSFYCRPDYLADLAQRNGIARWTGLNEIERLPGASVWYRQVPPSPTLLHIANSLLRSPYRGGARLLNAEAKMLELLCEVHNLDLPADSLEFTASECEERQLDNARRIIVSRLNTAVRTRDVAHMVGMSESRLKRNFKAKFKVSVFDYALECKMRHALELLRCKRMPVGLVARAVGYQHQTSFTAAFQQFFGFLPKQARKQMH